MPKTTRTFIAIPIPAPLGEKLTRLQSLLAPQVPAARWTTTLPFHMTLAFLGDVHRHRPERRLQGGGPGLRARSVRSSCVSRASAPSPARQGRVSSGPGCKPSEPWCLPGCRRPGPGSLTRVGYRPDDQRFTPHATLGRIKPDRRRPAARRPHRDPRAAIRTGPEARSRVSEVVTYASTLSPGRTRLCPARPGSPDREKKRPIILTRASADDTIVFLRTESRSP